MKSCCPKSCCICKKQINHGDVIRFLSGFIFCEGCKEKYRLVRGVDEQLWIDHSKVINNYINNLSIDYEIECAKEELRKKMETK